MSEHGAESGEVERAHHPDCPVNFYREMPERCRCVFLAVLESSHPKRVAFVPHLCMGDHECPRMTTDPQPAPGPD